MDTRGDAPFETAIENIDKQIVAAAKYARMWRAIVWSYERSYMTGEAVNVFKAIYEHPIRTIGTIVGIIGLQGIPGVDVAVDIVLIIEFGLDILQTAADLYDMFTSAGAAHSVVAMEHAAAKMGGIGGTAAKLLIWAATWGISKVGKKLKTYREGKSFLDKHGHTPEARKALADARGDIEEAEASMAKQRNERLAREKAAAEKLEQERAAAAEKERARHAEEERARQERERQEQEQKREAAEREQERLKEEAAKQAPKAPAKEHTGNEPQHREADTAAAKRPSGPPPKDERGGYDFSGRDNKSLARDSDAHPYEGETATDAAARARAAQQHVISQLPEHRRRRWRRRASDCDRGQRLHRCRHASNGKAREDRRHRVRPVPHGDRIPRPKCRSDQFPRRVNRRWSHGASPVRSSRTRCNAPRFHTESRDVIMRVDVSLKLDGESVRFEHGPASYGHGVYQIGDVSILVLNHLWPRTRIALVSAARPPSITGVVAIAVLPSTDSLTRIIVDVVEPPSLAPTTVALAAVHAAYDEELEPEAVVECIVRMPGHDLRARVAYDDARHEWSSNITAGGESERRALDGCAFYRSILIRNGFGAWSPHGFRIEDDPRAADDAIGFGVYSIGGHEVAVITEQVTPAQLDALVATPRPPSIEAVVVIAHEPMSSDISVSAVEPADLDRSLVVTAAACGAASSGFGAPSREYRARIGDTDVFEVVLSFDDDDRTWSSRVAVDARTPVRGCPGPRQAA